MFITAHGVKTHYQNVGSQGPQIVLLHGWGCTWDIWSPVIQQLSATARILIPDLPAFGQSQDPPRPWSSLEYSHWLSEFTATVLGDEKFILIGHSFGGKIAAVFALHQPDRLSQLVLVDAAGLPEALTSTKNLQEKIIGMVPAFIKQLIPANLKNKVIAMTGSSVDYALANQNQKNILKIGLKEHLAEDLPAITVPTLIIWGEQDETTPISQGRQFADLIPKSRLKVYAQSGHYPFVDQSSDFIADIQDILQYV